MEWMEISDSCVIIYYNGDFLVAEGEHMAYKIVFFDIDGTLVNKEKQIPPDTKEAVRNLKKRNIEVVIATGRAPFHLRRIAEELEIDSFVSFNGSYTVYKGQPIYEHAIGSSTLESLQKYSIENRHPLVYLSSEADYANYDRHPYVLKSYESLKLDAPKYDPDYWKKASIYQVLLYCEAEEEKHYKNKFHDLSFIRWHSLSLDILPAGGSKAKGIEAVLKHLRLSPEDAVAFGDGLNDREMLSFVGVGIAMGNAQLEVKRMADLVTRNADDGGISYGLRQIGLI